MVCALSSLSPLSPSSNARGGEGVERLARLRDGVKDEVECLVRAPMGRKESQIQRKLAMVCQIARAKLDNGKAIVSSYISFTSWEQGF